MATKLLIRVAKETNYTFRGEPLFHMSWRDFPPKIVFPTIIIRCIRNNTVRSSNEQLNSTSARLFLGEKNYVATNPWKGEPNWVVKMCPIMILGPFPRDRPQQKELPKKPLIKTKIGPVKLKISWYEYQLCKKGRITGGLRVYWKKSKIYLFSRIIGRLWW